MSRCLSWAIVALALGLRLACLDLKPPHFDEGVNGSFVDQMTRDGFYHYDPSNFHGPLHFYLLFIAQTLFGRHAWALRLPVALVSTACVWLCLRFEPWLGRRACQFAALAMAISPAMVFYGRYAIHESELLFFLMLTVWGLAGLWTEGAHRSLWATLLGITGMILTKETYVIHLAAMLLTVPALFCLEWFSRSAPLPFLGGTHRWRTPLAVCAGVVLFFYSGGFLDWSSLPGLWETFSLWFATGTHGASGHEKEWSYWLELLVRYEWPAAFGLMACLPALLGPNRSRLLRTLCIFSLGTLSAYSLVAYKTPWCILVLMWPFLLLFGIAMDHAISRIDTWTGGVVAALLLGTSLGASWLLNFREYTNENEPYVYVQTLPELQEKLMGPLAALTQADPRFFQLYGYIFTPEHHPLSWMLAEFPHVNLFKPEEAAEEVLVDPDFLLVDDSIAPQIEARLHEPYFKDDLTIRGSASDHSILYLREKTFGPCFPRRVAEVPGTLIAPPVL